MIQENLNHDHLFNKWSVDWRFPDRDVMPLRPRYSVPSHYMDKCWFIVNWAKRALWKLNQNKNNFPSRKWNWKWHQQIVSHFILKSMSWWRHQMETFARYWPFVRGIHRSAVNSPHKGQWRGTSMFSLICALIDGWVNNREASDLRRHRAHYDVIVMCSE